MNEFSDIADLQTVRRTIHDRLGSDAVRELHRPIPWLDSLVVAAFLIGFIGIFVTIASVPLSWTALVLLSLVQGWIIHTLALIGHDLFVHRNLWPRSVGPLLSSLVFVPATMSGRTYRIGHLRHHARIGTDDDTEAGLADINTQARRLLFLTLVGFKLARSGKWGNAGVNGYQALVGAKDDDHQVIAKEKRSIIGFIVVILALLVLAPWQVAVYGYLLPIVLVAPVLSSIRIVIEHAVVDRDNPYSLATPYRTGWITRLLYFVNPGDCHLMHHVFPRVPWYHMPRLVRLAWPTLIEHGVQPRTSLLSLLKGWFVLNNQHRTNWPT